MFISFTILQAAMPEVSAECSSAFETFQACAVEGFSKDMDLLFQYLRLVGESADCFEAADDDAAIGACFAPLWGVLGQACPNGLDALKAACDTTSDEFGDLAIDMFEDIAYDLEDVAVSLEEDEEEEDEFIAVNGKCMRLRCLGLYHHLSFVR